MSSSFNTLILDTRHKHLIVGENGSLELKIESTSDSNVLDIDVNKNATLFVVDITSNSTINISADSGACIKIVGLKFSGRNSNYNINLNGENSKAELYGLVIGNESQNININSVVNHFASNTVSNQLFKAIGSDNSYIKFEGLIFVAPDIAKVEAYQQNKNILLSDNANVLSIPQLKIYADDVKCSHGSTTGKEDDAAIFYMRQRGISSQNAQRLLLSGFALDILKEISDSNIREIYEDKITKIIEKL